MFHGSVNKECMGTGSKEMIAIGRAFISNFIAERLFEKYFHPGLDAALSQQLKSVEHGIRRNAASSEEDDSIIAKKVAWRITTLDALRPDLQSPEAAEHRSKLTETIVSELMTELDSYLRDLPTGTDAGVRMIVDLAVGISANIPLESRDIRVLYPTPGQYFDSAFMKQETGLPPLTSAINAGEVDDHVDEKDGLEDKKAGLMKAFKGKLSAPQGAELGTKQDGGSKVSLTNRPGTPSGKSDDAGKVRIAGFLAVEVRGRSILVKAPVYLYP
jgi:hypothetical protein